MARLELEEGVGVGVIVGTKQGAESTICCIKSALKMTGVRDDGVGDLNISTLASVIC